MKLDWFYYLISAEKQPLLVCNLATDVYGSVHSFLDSGGINSGAVTGGVVGGFGGAVAIIAIPLVIGFVRWKLLKKCKFVSSLNQVTRFAFMRCGLASQ